MSSARMTTKLGRSVAAGARTGASARSMQRRVRIGRHYCCAGGRFRWLRAPSGAREPEAGSDRRFEGTPAGVREAMQVMISQQPHASGARGPATDSLTCPSGSAAESAGRDSSSRQGTQECIAGAGPTSREQYPMARCDPPVARLYAAATERGSCLRAPGETQPHLLLGRSSPLIPLRGRSPMICDLFPRPHWLQLSLERPESRALPPLCYNTLVPS